LGEHTAPRTANASGQSSELVSQQLRTVFGTAPGSGIGGSSNLTLHSNIRSAPGFGSSGSSASGLHTAPRTASGSGTSSSTNLSEVITFLRSATASGGATASDSAVRRVTNIRTASGSGVSGQTALYDADPISGITAGYWGLQALVS
jgi:hypothetical protein